MESLTGSFCSPPPVKNHPKAHKTTLSFTFIIRNAIKKRFLISTPTSQTSISQQNHILPVKTSHLSPDILLTFFSNSSSNRILDPKTLPDFLGNYLVIFATSSLERSTPIHLLNRSKNHNSVCKTFFCPRTVATHLTNLLKNHFPMFKNVSLKGKFDVQVSAAVMTVFAPFPCLATETIVPSEQISDKINLEAILISIDNFFNQYPLFGPGVAFIWLVVIPLTQEYLKKFKFVSAFYAFKKLRDDPKSQLLDIRDKQSLLYLGSPNLKILNKNVVQIQFTERKEDSFMRNVLEKFRDPSDTTICILDNFDGNSMKVAELLFKNGFKEAYAVKGGLRGKNGWQEIQEKLLPPSMHVFPKEGKTSRQLEINGEETNRQTPSRVENGNINLIQPSPRANHDDSRRSSSPYPNYPDMKPPSSPTPSKPRS